MAELNVKLTGDAKGLKQSLSEAAAAMSAAESKMVADARAADAAILVSHKDAAQKELATLKEQVAAARQAAKDKAGAEKDAAREQLATLQQVVQAKKTALAEISRAERAAASAAKDQQREAVTRARREAAIQVGGGRGRSGSETAENTGDLVGLGKGFLGVQAIKKAFDALERFAEKIDELNTRLDQTVVKADESRQNRVDSLRFAGFDKATATNLAKTGEAAVATGVRFRATDLDAAFKNLQSASGPVDAKEVQTLLAKGDRLSLAGGASLLAQGFGGAQAVDIAGRFAAASGGAALTPDLAQMATKYQGSKAFSGPGDLAAFLAASAVTGIKPSVDNPLAAEAAAKRAAVREAHDQLFAADSDQDTAAMTLKKAQGKDYAPAKQGMTAAINRYKKAEAAVAQAQAIAEQSEQAAADYDPINRPFTNGDLFDEYTRRRGRAGAGPLRGSLSKVGAAVEQAKAQADLIALEGDQTETMKRLDRTRMTDIQRLTAAQEGGSAIVKQALMDTVPWAGYLNGRTDRPINVRIAGRLEAP